jgi:hypothetical protein
MKRNAKNTLRSRSRLYLSLLLPSLFFLSLFLRILIQHGTFLLVFKIWGIYKKKHTLVVSPEPPGMTSFLPAFALVPAARGPSTSRIFSPPLLSSSLPQHPLSIGQPLPFLSISRLGTHTHTHTHTRSSTLSTRQTFYERWRMGAGPRHADRQSRSDVLHENTPNGSGVE